MNAKVKNIDWADRNNRELKVIISAKDSIYVDEAIGGYGSPTLINSSSIIEGFDHVLEFGHMAVSAMKGNVDFIELAEKNRLLRRAITESQLASRVKQLLSAIDYDTLTDFQAKCVLLVERELKDK